jgi:hypothetical protein
LVVSGTVSLSPVPPVLIMKAKTVVATVASTMALMASDQWTPTSAPPMPTVTPLNDFNPMLATL